jgi:hypothetical protein
MPLNGLAQPAKSSTAIKNVPGLTPRDLIRNFFGRLFTVRQRFEDSLKKPVLAFLDLVHPRLTIPRSKQINIVTPYDEMTFAVGVAPY